MQPGASLFTVSRRADRTAKSAPRVDQTFVSLMQVQTCTRGVRNDGEVVRESGEVVHV
jgi:hypothetical protein